MHECISIIRCEIRVGGSLFIDRLGHSAALKNISEERKKETGSALFAIWMELLDVFPPPIPGYHLEIDLASFILSLARSQLHFSSHATTLHTHTSHTRALHHSTHTLHRLRPSYRSSSLTLSFSSFFKFWETILYSCGSMY